MSDIIHPSTQPLLMDFKRVIAQIHSVRDKELHDGVEVSVKHAAVNAKDAKSFFE
tara:strand:+ start:927 stop:1091 length:165 start_codon:yes stop_codon:yes gene_type:complete